MSYAAQHDDCRSGVPEWHALIGLTLPDPRPPASSIDWDLLIDIAERHKSQLLLARGIEKTCPEVLPGAARSKLAALRSRSAARALWLAGETVRCVEALRASGVDVMTLKGAPVSLALYGDVALRSPGDIDILVPRDQVSRTAEILCSMGYECDYLCLLHSSRARERLLWCNKDLVFYHPGQRCWIECHWRLDPRPGSSFFAGAQDGYSEEIAFGGALIPTLRPAENFIYLCFHGAKHLWQRLKWLNDIRWSIQGPRHADMDWDLVARKASELRMTRIVASAILLVQHLDGIPLPAALQDLAGDNPGVRKDVARFAGLLAKTGGLAQDPEPTMLHAIREQYHLAVVSAKDDGRVIDTLPIFFRPSIKDLKRVDLPKAMAWAYPFLRASRVLRQGLFQGR